MSIANLSHTYDSFVDHQFRESRPGITRCLRCRNEFLSNDIPTNRVCGPCSRVNRNSCTRAVKLERNDGRIVRKKAGGGNY